MGLKWAKKTTLPFPRINVFLKIYVRVRYYGWYVCEFNLLQMAADSFKCPNIRSYYTGHFLALSLRTRYPSKQFFFCLRSLHFYHRLLLLLHTHSHTYPVNFSCRLHAKPLSYMKYCRVASSVKLS